MLVGAGSSTDGADDVSAEVYLSEGASAQCVGNRHPARVHTHPLVLRLLHQVCVTSGWVTSGWVTAIGTDGHVRMGVQVPSRGTDGHVERCGA